MTMKHTPGPWLVFTPEDHDGQSDSRTLGVDSADGIAVVWYGDGPDAGIPNDADARLISAAPELLEALQAAMRFIDSHVADPDITREMRDAWAELERIGPHEVIAKATGAE